MKKRIELCLLKKRSINDFSQLYEQYDIANVYIKVSLEDLSITREKLVNLNYTTRLFIVLEDNKKEEYIFGKLKGSKGVFNEHCKNTVFRKPIENVIMISSNKDNVVIIDEETIKKDYMKNNPKENREWMLI